MVQAVPPPKSSANPAAAEQLSLKELALAKRAISILLRRGERTNHKAARLAGEGSRETAAKAIRALAEINRRLERGLSVEPKMLAELAESLGGRSVPLVAVQSASSQAAKELRNRIIIAVVLVGWLAFAGVYWWVNREKEETGFKVAGKVAMDKRVLGCGAFIHFEPAAGDSGEVDGPAPTAGGATIPEGKVRSVPISREGTFEVKLPGGMYRVSFSVDAECEHASRLKKAWRSPKTSGFRVSIKGDVATLDFY